MPALAVKVARTPQELAFEFHEVVEQSQYIVVATEISRSDVSTSVGEWTRSVLRVHQFLKGEPGEDFPFRAD